MKTGKLLDHCKPDAAAFDALRVGLRSREQLEDAVDLIRWNSCAIVTYRRKYVLAIDARIDGDESPVIGVTRGVGEQIGEDLGQTAWIRMKQDVLGMAGKRLGYCYMTDKGLPNPWDRLPGYWEAELAAVLQANDPDQRQEP